MTQLKLGYAFSLVERQTKKDLLIHWEPGTNNNADYFTKHHSPTRHKQVRTRYILKGFNIIHKKIRNKFSIVKPHECEGVLIPWHIPVNPKVHDEILL